MRIDYPRSARTGICRFAPSWRQWLLLVVLGFVVLSATFTVLVIRTTVPTPNEIASAQASIVYWNDGKTEIGHIGEANRISVPLADVPLDTQHAVLSAEDRDFYDHGGFSIPGIARAAWNNLSGGSTQGASTITQQYTKNAFLTQDRTWSRKLDELLISVKLETQVSKDQILEDYLNTIYFGRGSYGIQTAATAYFGKPASKLDLGESAALAAIIRSPGGYAPETNRLKLKMRWNYVLAGMVEKGWITQAQRDATKFPKFVPSGTTTRFSGTTGYLLQAVRSELARRGLSEDTIEAGGLRITTTFDRSAQRAAVRAVKDQVPKEGAKGLRVGLAAVRPGTGEVVAMYGGADYAKNQVNNATQAIGQAGSTFKPFALAAATEAGIGLDTVWDGNNGIDVDGYRVVNEGDRSWGNISLLQATEDSVNSVYVQLSQQVGYDAVVDAAVRAGVPRATPALEPVRTVALGVASPHVLDMASAFATFAADGNSVSPTVLKQVVGANDGVLLEHAPVLRQQFTPEVADTVNYALQKVVTDGTGAQAQGLDRPVAGKTGTTNGNLSAWFVGYTPQLATAVMFVRDGKDGNPVSLAGLGGGGSVTGGNYPTRVWTAFMQGALAGQPVEQFATPAATNVPEPSPTTTSASPSPTTTSASPSPTTTSPSPSPTRTSVSPSPTRTTERPTPTPPAPPGSAPPDG
ncbi:MAG TPA: transglycosylase domain-containing protein [Candidatus Nanopelagicales bacterium]|nr:transglycosylase domain-containing protein [Candidatus Nanopelagicales bacterium]